MDGWVEVEVETVCTASSAAVIHDRRFPPNCDQRSLPLTIEQKRKSERDRDRQETDRDRDRQRGRDIPSI